MSIVLDGTTGITTPGLTNTGTETIVNLTTTGNTILGDASTDTLNVGNGGLVKDASGNVGIGVTPNAGVKLNLPSTEIIGFAGTESNIVANAYYNAGYKYVTTGVATKYSMSAGTHVWYTAASGTAGNAITDFSTAKMTLDASGNLGIGTSSPSTKLHVMSASSALSFALSPSNSNTNIGYVTNDSTYLSFASGYGSTGVKFRVALAAPDNAATIDSSGNLLVGTSGVSLSQTKSIQIPGPALNSSTRNISVFNSQGYSSSAGLPVYCANWASSAQWGIGPDSGSADNTVRIGVVNSDANGAYWTGYAAVKGGAYTNASDYRLKKNVETVAGDVLSLIAQARPVSYNMIQKDEGGNDVETRKEIGFIAHELQALFPEFVTGEKDEVNGAGEVQAQGVDYAKFTAILVKAIQEQQALITTLTDRITALEAK